MRSDRPFAESPLLLSYRNSEFAGQTAAKGHEETHALQHNRQGANRKTASRRLPPKSYQVF